MQAPKHAALSLGLAGLVYFLFKSWTAAAASFIAGTLIDLDHLYDVYRHTGRLPGSTGCLVGYREMKDICENYRLKRVYLLLHSYELLIIGWAAGFILGWPLYYTGLIIGFTVHLMFDAFYNCAHPLFYFFTFRWYKGFDTRVLFDFDRLRARSGRR